MFLTKVSLDLQDKKFHLSEDYESTLCKRYSPLVAYEGQTAKDLLQGQDIKEFLTSICEGKQANPNICLLCLEKFRRSE